MLSARNISLSFCLLLAAVPAHAAGVRVLFDPSRPEIGPFPTDALTAPATTTTTGRRVRMPLPADCSAAPNACQEITQLNELDGFNLQTRVRVSFSGPVNLETLKDGIYLVARENYTQDEPGVHQPGDIVRLNQFVWGQTNNTAYAKPDGAMDQHRRYLLVVTDAVKDAAGDPVEADAAFTACASDAASSEYCRSLFEAVTAVEAKVAGASLYSTLSATRWLESARDALTSTAPAPRAVTPRGYLAASDLRALTHRRQVGAGAFENFDYPSLLFALVPASLQALAFGEFTSSNYLGPNRIIPTTLAPASGTQQIPYVAFVPRGAKPAGGYPVMIFGHGIGDNRFGAPALLSLAAASSGMATIAINAPGHGYGSGSTLRVGLASGETIDIPAPGRGVDANGDGTIGDREGCDAGVRSPLFLRDCLRQATVDLLQLVRAIRAGIDLDGDGTRDLDPTKISYAGQSLGSIYGTMLLAVEPSIASAVLNVGGGPVVDIARWSPGNRADVETNLAARTPPLPFNDNFPTRNQPVQVVESSESIEVQNVFETYEWLQVMGDPIGFAAHLKPSPLAGVGPKNILFQYPIGDQTVPNPTQTALARLSDMKSTTWVYRHDVVRARNSSLPANPHIYLAEVLNFSFLPIASSVQSQMIKFLATGEMDNPNGSLSALYGQDIFVQPDVLPEDFNYLEP